MPFVPSIVHPVEPLPPAKLIPPALTAPPKLIVVAVVLRRENVEELVLRAVVITGELLNTATPPEPVSSVRVLDNTEDRPDDIMFFEPSVNTNLDAVREGTLTVEATPDPMFNDVVAPPPKLIVVAVVFSKGNVV